MYNILLLTRIKITLFLYQTFAKRTRQELVFVPTDKAAKNIIIVDVNFTFRFCKGISSIHQLNSFLENDVCNKNDMIASSLQVFHFLVPILTPIFDCEYNQWERENTC